MAADVLDHPVWHALTGAQAAIARGGDHAVATDEAIGPLAAARDDSRASLEALAALIPPEDELMLMQTGPAIVPPGCTARSSAAGCQMIARAIVPGPPEPAWCALGEADAAEMLGLATLTRPGPFRAGTYRLGGFIGVRHDGRLVAMAGQRLRPPGHVEVSGVCTHPDHRGRGLAAGLMRVVGRRILDGGELPILHAYASNTGAIAMYRTLGFVANQAVTATVLARA